MKLVAKSLAVAALVLVTAGQSYAEPLRSTSIPSSLADDEKRLLPGVMNEFYGSFYKEKACWISTKSGLRLEPSIYRRGEVDAVGNTGNVDATYCMKPIRLDVTKSSGQKQLFIVAGGQQLNEDGQPSQCHPCAGVLGLIVLTPNGAKLGLVATNDLYEGYDTYGGYPQGDNIVRPGSEASVSIHKLGPNETYGWVAKLRETHSGYDVRWDQVYGVVGRSVTLLTAVITYFGSGEAAGCGSVGQEFCSDLSVKYAFETHSSASSFYPITLRVSGIYHGSPFRNSYRLVFDKNTLTYLAPSNMPDEIKPWVERTSESVRHDRSCDVAQDYPEKFNFNPEDGNAVMFGGCGKIEDILANSPNRTAWWGAVNCGYFAYRENKKRDASPYLNEDLKRGWAYGWDTAAKACKSGKLPVFGP